MRCITYKKGYKYQLVEAYSVKTGITIDHDIDTDYVAMAMDGTITVKKGYAWDGPSGPTIDTPDFMRGSLVHDALYQLMRLGELDNTAHRDPADRLLRKMCREDGMNAVRAWWVYWGVRLGAEPAADPANKKPVVKAPKGCG